MEPYDSSDLCPHPPLLNLVVRTPNVQDTISTHISPPDTSIDILVEPMNPIRLYVLGTYIGKSK